MDVLSPVSDDEREDGEIVDDELEDISDYSIPSDGKSDYNEGIIRAISLSSISGSDGDREYCERRVLLRALAGEERAVRASRRSARKRTCDDSPARAKASGGRKKRRDGVSRSRKHRRKSYSRSASLSSSSDSSVERHVLDSRTLRQLSKAVRIEHNAAKEEVGQKTLKDRLQRMIQPDALDDDDFNLSVIGVDDGDKQADNQRSLDDTFDKELAELRDQALKSAVLKKHMERMKRKEALNKLTAENASSDQNVNNKENDSNNPNSPTIETRIVEKVRLDDDSAEVTVEDDLDIMRAMLLASMSKKIATEQPSQSPSAIQPTLNHNSLSLSSSSSPIPPEFNDKKKSVAPFLLPPVKPLIIRVNHDSESDTDCEFDQDNEASNHQDTRPIATKIASSVEEFLRKQREQFEAKLVESEDANGNGEEEQANADESTLDKSFLKLLPKSQQQEYKLLKQKLLQAKTIKKVKKTTSSSSLSSTTAPSIPQGHPVTKSSKTDEKLRRDKKDRSQQKGKYKELTPLIRKIQEELTAQRHQEEHARRLLEQLKATRDQVTIHQQRHQVLVAQFKKARALVDLRWQKIAKAKALQQQKQRLKEEKEKRRQLERQRALEQQKSVVVNTETRSGNEGNNNESIPQNVQTERSSSAIDRDNTYSAATAAEVSEQSSKEVETTRISNGPSSDKTDCEPCIEPSSASGASEALSYISPLDRRDTSAGKNDPMEMLCPYELFGVCKDASCTFNHCP